MKRQLTAILLTGALAVTAIGAWAVSGAQQSAAAPTVTAASSAGTADAVLLAGRGFNRTNGAWGSLAPGFGRGLGGRIGLGFGRGLGGRMGPGFGRRVPGRILRVTAVENNTINATLWGSRAVTVTVDATTAYTEAGATASIADIHPGALIAVRGQRTGNATFKAMTVLIILPRVAGVVTTVGASSLTLTARDGMPQTITVDGNTRYVKGNQPGAFSDIKPGTVVAVEGTANGDGSLTARRIRIVLPRVAGRITAVNGSTLTVTDIWGMAHTVVVLPGATYATPGNPAAAPATPSAGMGIVAQGALESDGKTLDAQRILILPSFRGMGMGPGAL